MYPKTIERDKYVTYYLNFINISNNILQHYSSLGCVAPLSRWAYDALSSSSIRLLASKLRSFQRLHNSKYLAKLNIDIVGGLSTQTHPGKQGCPNTLLQFLCNHWKSSTELQPPNAIGWTLTSEFPKGHFFFEHKHWDVEYGCVRVIATACAVHANKNKCYFMR